MAQDFSAAGTPPMIGKMLSINEWLRYVADYAFTSLQPTKVVLHHTWRPTVAQWRGLRSMQGMQQYYAGKGWTSAPHIYVGPDGIWLFTPMSQIGIHANMGNGSLMAGWYSIGVEMVGDYDHVRPSGFIWEATKAVIGGVSQRLNSAPHQLLSFHREYTQTKSCPGWAVTKDWVGAEVDRWLTTQVGLTPPDAYTDQSPICAVVPEAHAAFVAAVQRRCPPRHYDVSDLHLIASTYWLQATALGLDPWLAMAQCLHETANLTSWWCARPRRNPAGIGVTGQTRIGQPGDPMPPGWAYDDADRVWRMGLSFRGWISDSIPAHLGRLLAYATTPAARTPAQQQAVTTALSYRPLPPPVHGSASILQALGMAHNPSGLGWASPGTDYGARIAALANRLRGGAG